MKRGPSADQLRYTRGQRGRFASSGSQTLQKQRKLRRQQTYLSNRQTLKEELFQKFLLCIFVHATYQYSIPCARSGGPLVELFEKLVKKPYRLGRPERYKKAKCFYLDGKHLPNAIQSNKALLQEINMSLPVRCNKFRACRLPRMNGVLSEMKKVEKWIHYLALKGALKTSTITEAIELSKGIFNQQDRKIKDKEEAQKRKVARIDQVDAAVEPISTRSETDVLSRFIDERPVGASNVRERDVEEPSRMTKRRKLIELAKDIDIFLMICLCLDKDRQREFELYAEVFVSEYKREYKDLPDLIKDVIIYAEWTKHGIKNEEEHSLRELRLKATQVLLEEWRQLIGEKSYPEIRWNVL